MSFEPHQNNSGRPKCAASSKRCFQSRKKAKMCARRIETRGGPRMDFYRCSDCRQYHLTRVKPGSVACGDRTDFGSESRAWMVARKEGTGRVPAFCTICTGWHLYTQNAWQLRDGTAVQKKAG